ncbi:hypothetical protein ACFL96_19530, partial [Thermoproteota archaeon]
QGKLSKYSDQELTGEMTVNDRIETGVVVFPSLPSGQYTINIRHPNFHLANVIELRTKKNLRKRELFIPPKTELSLLVRMKIVEEEGDAYGRLVDVEKAHTNVIPSLAPGSELNDPAKDIGYVQQEHGELRGEPVVALERIQVGNDIKYIRWGQMEVTTDPEGFFRMHKLPIGKTIIIGTPIKPPEGKEEAYVTHLGYVLDGKMHIGTEYGRGGQGGRNKPPPTTLFFGRMHEWRRGEKGRWGFVKNVYSTVSKTWRYHGKEENIVISISEIDKKGIPLAGIIMGKVVSGDFIIKKMPDKNAKEIMENKEVFPKGPGLTGNVWVRAIFFQGGMMDHTEWYLANETGVFAIPHMKLPSEKIIVQAAERDEKGEPIPGKIGFHVLWPDEPPAGTTKEEFDLTQDQSKAYVLVPIWGMNMPLFRPIDGAKKSA